MAHRSGMFFPVLTTKSRYSVRAMIDIARNQGQGPVRTVDIARRQRMSHGYLERLLKQLVAEGLVVSRRGPGGGYLLAHEPDQIGLDSIVRASGENMAAVPCDCTECENECALVDECPARPIWSEVRTAAERCLESHRLSEFVVSDSRAGGKTDNGLRPLRSTAGSH